MNTLFLSYRLDHLVDRLIEQLDGEVVDPLQARIIVVPHSQMKQWLLLEIAKRKGIAMGLQIVELAHFYPALPTSLEIFCHIYRSLVESVDPDLQAYLGGKKKRALDLTEELVPLFFAYGEYGKNLFSRKAQNWQEKILHHLFIDGPLRLPVQVELSPPDSIICFGIDEIAPIYWEFLFRAPSLSVYLFSPCIEFWTDVCSERERRALGRYWKKRGTSARSLEQLDIYLREAPRSLANWGKLGRETLNILDHFEFEIEEIYPPIDTQSALKQMQSDLLSFQELKGEVGDDSIKVFLTGSSRLKEIECLRDEIIRLDLPYDQISVLAPDLAPYVPLIEFIFSDQIPFRISGVNVTSQSPFKQGLMRLLGLASGRGSVEEVLTLFESTSFYRKQGWDSEKLTLFRSWIAYARIQWGWDSSHRSDTLSQMLGEKNYEDQSSWEKGLDRLLETFIYLSPLQMNGDQFEEFLRVILSLKTLCFSEEKTLASWADFLKALVEDFLLIDSSNEADTFAYTSFSQLLLRLRQSAQDSVFPFEVIQRLLSHSSSGQIHSSHLHAVRFSSIEQGAQMPAKALFLIGMDEESFPRLKTPSSLNLLKKEGIWVPDQADRDRYLFLQAIFSATDYLRISYCHISEEEGKPVNPSLLVEELPLSEKMISCYQPLKLEVKKNFFPWPKRGQFQLPEGEITVSILELKQLARHPWKFYLQKGEGIYLNEPLEGSFALQKGKALRSTFEKPLEKVLNEGLPFGILGETLKFEIREKYENWQSQLNEWEIQPFSLIFRESCREAHWDGPHFIVPPLYFHWDRLKVCLVGEVEQASIKGLICTQDDTIGGLLKAWPESLAVALALNAPQIYMLKSGKIKTIENVHESLKAFIEYYFLCLKAPSPLLPDWADSILRKGQEDLEKKMRKGSSFEDPFVDWVLDRIEKLQSEEIMETWSPLLKQTFIALTSIYPMRKSSGSV